MNPNPDSHLETAKRMAEAADSFLGSLAGDQKSKAELSFADEEERRNWHYIPRERQGLSLKEMDGRQRELARKLVATGVSKDANEKVDLIIRLEPVLAEIEGPGRKRIRDPELYFLSVFGQPGSDAPWGWRFEGHHISLNYTIAGGTEIAALPTFFGANPAHVRHGDLKGARALRDEEEMARDLLASLDGEQKDCAIIDSEAPADILTRNLPRLEGKLVPEGLPANELTQSQADLLRALVEVYIGRLPDVIGKGQREKFERADPDSVHFASAGGESKGKGHYYRLQGASFLAEYDNTQNEANHIHAVWRDLDNDFGDDVLPRHYKHGHH